MSAYALMSNYMLAYTWPTGLTGFDNDNNVLLTDDFNDFASSLQGVGRMYYGITVGQ